MTTEEQTVVRLEDLRRRAGLSQSALAALAEVSPTTVNGIETGKGPTPRLRSIRALARALQVKPEEIDEFRPVLGFDPPPPAPGPEH